MSTASSTSEIVGTSPIIRALMRDIPKVANIGVPILITGETGTGKELFALSIHDRSNYSDGPFVAVNCSVIPENLIESELFGYEKGAFTGATQRKIGRIEAAAGGTILLDEIGDLSPKAQLHLLRFLDDSTSQRLGSTTSRPLDIRVIAATHVNLERAIAEGRFREDLYFRLNVLCVEMPPLRLREGDVELLAHRYYNEFAKQYTTKAKGISSRSLERMNHHDWPGNVRELINRIRRAVIMCEHRLIEPSDLGFNNHDNCVIGRRMTLGQARALAEREAILDALRYTKHNLSRAARELGVSRVTLYRLMERHKLENGKKGLSAYNTGTPDLKLIKT